ncbi:MAG: class I SAM-dependent methyltransferase [Chloroherpetonaceae bacterium]
MKKKLRTLVQWLDPLIALIAFPAGALLKAIRYFGIHELPRTKKMLGKIGVFPIRNHYYEPLIEFNFKRPLSQERHLPGIALNLEAQIQFLKTIHYQEGLLRFFNETPEAFDLNNINFQSGDVEMWFSIVRHFKPKRLIEIGSGYSTILAIEAIKQNKQDDPAYECRHRCIEPFEMKWLEQTPVEVVRKKVEDLDITLFQELEENDILFIDSSHMIRPQGDVLFEFLEVLPMLKKGVVVHIHDIFTPRDYPEKWVIDEVRFWNEQYLLEAFLTGNPEWKVLAAVNYLKHRAFNELKAVCPFLTEAREPGSFYIQKTA